MSANDLKSKFEETRDAAVDASKAALDLARDTASAVKDEAASLAGKTAMQARDAAVERIDSARATVADVGERLARTLQDSADEARGMGAKALSGAASGLTTAATALRSQSIEDLLVRAKDFAQRNPGAFAAGAAVAGFAVARFLRSSSRALEAERRAMYETERVYRDASRRLVEGAGQSRTGFDGGRS